MIRPTAAVAALAAYPLAALGRPTDVSLAQNESAFAPSPAALEAGRAALAEARLYPDPDWRALRDAIAAAEGVDADAILCGAGSMALIDATLRAFVGPGDAVVGARHGYAFFATVCASVGATLVTAPEDGFTVSVDALLGAITGTTRVVVVCNPGNPTGTRIAGAEIVRLRAGLPPDVLLLVDQAYGEFDDQDPAPVRALPARGDTVILRSFSKAYALAGLRVGWGLFPPAIGREVRKVLNPNAVSGVAQAMAAAAMRDRDHLRALVERTAALRDAFAARLRAAGHAPPESHANFLLIPFPSVEAARRADARLRDHGLILRGLDGYGLPHCLRATIADAGTMDRVAAVLEAEARAAQRSGPER